MDSRSARSPSGPRAGVDTYRRLTRTGDPPADALAAAFAALPAGRGRQMLDQALAHGVESVSQPPRALLDFFAQVDVPPVWVDWERIERGGALLLRSGIVGIAVLNLMCLPTMYRSPTGNKPLVFTGQMLRRAPRRLAETARFMLETSRPGGLRRSAAGFETTVKVRLMHAQVRRLLRGSPRWNVEWGEPVSQLYMAATGVTLSVLFLHGLRRLGLRVGRGEADALLALWRYSGHLMGVLPELQCSTEEEGWHLMSFTRYFEGAADIDSRELIHAVMTASYLPQLDRYSWRVPIAFDLSRDLLGHAVADELGYPPARGWGWLRRVTWPVLAARDALQRVVPGARERAARQGAAHADALIAAILAGGRTDTGSRCASRAPVTEGRSS